MHGSNRLFHFTTLLILGVNGALSYVIIQGNHAVGISSWWLIVYLWALAIFLLVALRKVLTAISDVKCFKSLNTQLVLARQAAELSNRNKSDFLCNISHEIRTPLNAIIGFSDLLMKGLQNKPQKHQLNLINRSAEHLLNLIEDLLDLSRLESGEVVIQEKQFNLREMLDETIAVLSHSLLKRPLLLIPIFDQSTNATVCSDPLVLRQILLNLLTNAIKYTPSGQILLRVELLDSRLVIQLTDSGIGMTKSQVEQLFDPFVRHHEHELNESGTGLGMAITRHILELLSASIEVQSNPGEGTAIDLSIPISIIKSKTDKLLSLDSILLIHSEPLVQESLHRTVYPLANHIVTLPDCGELRQVDTFELVIIELNLWRALSPTEQRHYKDNRQVILVQTAIETTVTSLPEDERLTIIDFPVSQTDLISQILYPQASEPKLSVIEEPLQTKFPVLVVDDNQVNLEFMQHLMDEIGVETITAQSGIEAINLLRKALFSLVFMDIRMPVMDGIKTLEKINLLKLTTKPPVIALTANAMHGEADFYRQLGFADYLSKPVSKKDIKTLLRRYLVGKQDQKSGLNWSRSLEIAANDQQLAQDMLQKVMQALPNLSRHLRLIQNGDSADVEYIHRISGIISYTGAQQLKRMLADLEKQLRNDPHSCINKQIESILPEIHLVMAQSLTLLEGERSDKCQKSA